MKVLLTSDWGPNLSGTTVNVYDETARYLERMGLGAITDHNEIGTIGTYPAGKPTILQARLTRPADINAYAAGDAINTVVADVKQKETISLTGTVGTATIVCGALSHVATFATNLTTTAANFVTANAAAYLTAGLVLTSSTNTLIIEASVAGVPFTAPTITNLITDLAGTVAHTTANVTIPNITLANAAISVGGGGIITDMQLTSNITTLAGCTIRLWLYRLAPTGLVGDNVAMTNSVANTQKGRRYIDVTFDALLAGSDAVVAQVQPFFSYMCDVASKDLLMRVQTLSAFTPTSAGWIDFDFTITQQS